MGSNLLKVHSIFVSISGECGLFLQGSWTTFIRLDRCNLKCSYCDTAITQKGNSFEEMPIEAIMVKVQQLRIRQVLITGGEPLLQKELLSRLCFSLHHQDFSVSIETNGTIFPTIPFVHCWIVDYKLPSSGMMGHMMDIEEFYKLPSDSWIKFVCSTEEDYRLAVDLWKTISAERTSLHLAMSACSPLSHADLFEWMKRDHLFEVLLSGQIHKLMGLKEESGRTITTK